MRRGEPAPREAEAAGELADGDLDERDMAERPRAGADVVERVKTFLRD